MPSVSERTKSNKMYYDWKAVFTMENKLLFLDISKLFVWMIDFALLGKGMFAAHLIIPIFIR